MYLFIYIYRGSRGSTEEKQKGKKPMRVKKSYTTENRNTLDCFDVLELVVKVNKGRKKTRPSVMEVSP